VVEDSNFYKVVKVINNMEDWEKYIDTHLSLSENSPTTEETKRAITEAVQRGVTSYSSFRESTGRIMENDEFKRERDRLNEMHLP